MGSTKLFLLYHDEDISKFNHPDIIPVKLKQTEYFESEAFRMIDSVPDADYIGIITPGLFRKCPNITLKKLFEMKPDPIIKIFTEHKNLEVQGFDHHGPNFRILWNWLLNQHKVSRSNYAVFYSNLWITSRSLFLEYLVFAKRTMDIIDNAPPEIKDILDTDPNYRDARLSKQVLESRFGKPYYPWQPFLMERVICLFMNLKSTGKN
jgi:hypothetical protein